MACTPCVLHALPFIPRALPTPVSLLCLGCSSPSVEEAAADEDTACT